MKIISSNVHGLNSWKKRALVKRSLQQQNPSIVLLQETKLDDTDSNIIKSIWSSPLIGWTTLDMIDTLGGLLILWRTPDFVVLEVIQSLYTVSIHISLADGFSFSTVHGPSDGLDHPNFWQELDDLVGLGGNSWIIGGDFNITRWSWEKSHDQSVTK